MLCRGRDRGHALCVIRSGTGEELAVIEQSALAAATEGGVKSVQIKKMKADKASLIVDYHQDKENTLPIPSY